MAQKNSRLDFGLVQILHSTPNLFLCRLLVMSTVLYSHGIRFARWHHYIWRCGGLNSGSTFSLDTAVCICSSLRLKSYVHVVVLCGVQELHFALQIFNFLFTSVFVLEAVVKITALGFGRYIKDRSVC